LTPPHRAEFGSIVAAIDNPASSKTDAAAAGVEATDSRADFADIDRPRLLRTQESRFRGRRGEGPVAVFDMAGANSDEVRRLACESAASSRQLRAGRQGGQAIFHIETSAWPACACCGPCSRKKRGRPDPRRRKELLAWPRRKRWSAKSDGRKGFSRGALRALRQKPSGAAPAADQMLFCTSPRGR